MPICRAAGVYRNWTRADVLPFSMPGPAKPGSEVSSTNGVHGAQQQSMVCSPSNHPFELTEQGRSDAGKAVLTGAGRRSESSLVVDRVGGCIGKRGHACAAGLR